MIGLLRFPAGPLSTIHVQDLDFLANRNRQDGRHDGRQTTWTTDLPAFQLHAGTATAGVALHLVVLTTPWTDWRACPSQIKIGLHEPGHGIPHLSRHYGGCSDEPVQPIISISITRHPGASGAGVQNSNSN